MSVTLPSLSAGSAGSAYSAAVVNAAINQQKTNVENVVNGIQGIDALLWNNSTATLASDTLSLTAKPRVLVIDTQGAAATDDLSTISNGTAYQQLWIKAANAGRVITVKHNVGNIQLNGGADVVLSSTAWLLLFYDGTQWTDTFVPPLFTTPGLVIDKARTELGANATSWTISSIAGTYKHLLLLLELKTDVAAVSDGIYLRFNADSTSGNYHEQHSLATGATMSAVENITTQTAILLAQIAGGATAGSQFGRAFIFIPNYASTTLQRTLTYNGGVKGGTTTGLLKSVNGIGAWANAAAAISSITLLPQSGTNIIALSAYTLYGLM